ncbi:MAG TPA: hypothetical protein VNH11_12300 [Pirellulales bacterium]|nr:hypothetical protein [Pirellulales bacterium]
MGLQFTYEIAGFPPANVGPADWLIDSSMRFASAADLIERLPKKLHWLAFELDATHPHVIHIIDKRLQGRNGYALEKKIDIDFAGTLDGLAWALHRRIGNLYGFRGAAIHDITTDYETETVVEARNKTVRQILTDAVPLRCYGPILWRARMATDGGDAAAPIDVNFYENKEDRRIGWSRWWWWLETLHKPNAAGKRLDCYFTIETTYREPSETASCLAYFNDDERPESPDALIAELTKRVKWLTAVKNPKRPEIVHLVDERLLTLPGYALRRRVDVDYDGTPDGLVDWLATHGDGVGRKVGPRTGDALNGDPETRIGAHAKGQPLRGVLTACMPTERERAVLWHARTWVRKDGPHTTVEYVFPR